MRNFCFFLACVILTPFMQGCPKPTPTIKEEYEVNKWIYSVMTKSYFWSDEMPEFDNSGAEEAKIQDYFNTNLRYRVNINVGYEDDTYGDRFSQITFTGQDSESTLTRAATEQEYDFGFLLSQITQAGTGKLLHVQVLYVIPGTQADRAGLRRGDAFNEISGTALTKANLKSELSANEIKINVLNRETDGEITIRKGWYYDYPILVDTIYETPEKTAYLMYNHFTNGDSNAGYSKKLTDAFGRYRLAEVETLILDLRYNGGGEVENARLLASLIAPVDMLGEEFMRMQRNSTIDDWAKFDKYILYQNLIENADIKNLYVITSRNTASASELIIHTLRPIFRDASRTLRVVGETTYGKNVGSLTYTNSRYDWELSPICMKVFNLDKVSGYELGLKPDNGMEGSEYIYRRETEYYILPPLGDFENENLLNIAIRQFHDVPAVPTRSSSETRGTEELLKPEPMVPMRGLSAGVVLID